MLGSSDWQSVCSVVVDDLGNGEEGGAVLPEDVAAICRLSELHVHETFAAPGSQRETLLKHSQNYQYQESHAVFTRHS